NIALRVEPARLQVVEDVVEVDGVVDLPPGRRAFISSQLAGTLHRIQVDRGQVVRAGQVVAQVARLEVQNLQLDLLRAHLESELLEDSLRRLRSAAESVPARQLWETGSLRNAAVNRRESLKERLTVIGLGLEQIQALLTDQKLVEAVPLRSPIDGV